MKANIIFHYVRMKNFVAIGDQWLQIYLDKNPTTIVHGHNGACKSGAMLDSICFNLYGKPFKSIKIGELVNNKNNKDMLTEVSFTKGSDTYRVVRGYKPKVFEIYKNEQKLPDTNHNQQTLDQILGIPFNTFKQMVVTGKSNYQSFMDLAKDKRREFVESLLDISVFRGMLERHKQNIKSLDARIFDEEYIRDTSKKELLAIKEALNAISSIQSKGKAEKLFEIKEEIGKIDNKLNSLKEEVAKFQDYSYYQDKISKIRDAISNLNTYIQEGKFQINSYQKENDFFSKHTNCPTCQQTISTEFRKEKLSANTQEILSFEEANLSHNKKKEKLVEKLQELESEFEKLISIEREVKHLLQDIDRLEIKESEILAEPESRDSLETEKLKSKAKEISAHYKKAEKNIEKLIKEKATYKDASFMLSDAGIKAMIISKYLPVINSLVNENLSKLGLFATISFDEEFNETIKKRGFDDFSFYQLSEGEKLRVDLSIMLAWRELASLRSNLSINLLVMDEIFNTSMDYQGCKLLMDMLNDKEGKQNTFIVSPNADDIIDMARSSIELKKDDYGYTYIVK